jgi:hypothetical protein
MFVAYTGALSSRRCDWAWQWFNWTCWPVYQNTTQSIWRPGNVPFRARAWQPDVSGWTVERFRHDMGAWAAFRGVTPSQVVVDMNTGTASTY